MFIDLSKCTGCINNKEPFCNCIRFSGIDSKPDLFNIKFIKSDTKIINPFNNRPLKRNIKIIKKSGVYDIVEL